MALVFVNGELVAPDKATVSVFDHGLVVGDGVFETILLHRRSPFAIRRHLERLERSAQLLGLAPPTMKEVASAVDQVVDSCEFDSGRIRITLTSGAGPLGSARGSDSATLVVAAEPCELHDEPTEVAVVPWTRNEHGGLSGLKTTSYAENARALAYAQDRGASEAIFANTAGMLCEGTGSNVFVVLDGKLLTPPVSSGCLDGVTRALVLEYHGGTEHDLPVAAFLPGSIREAFLTSTLRGVQPIASIDGQPLEEVGGEETEKAAAAFAALLTSDSEP